MTVYITKKKKEKKWHNDIVLQLNANSFPSTLIFCF